MLYFIYIGLFILESTVGVQTYSLFSIFCRLVIRCRAFQMKLIVTNFRVIPEVKFWLMNFKRLLILLNVSNLFDRHRLLANFLSLALNNATAIKYKMTKTYQIPFILTLISL